MTCFGGRGRIALATIAACTLVGTTFGVEAHAQTIDCERVSYNGRVIINCTTDPDGTPPPTPVATSTPTPDPQASPAPEPTRQADDDDDTESDDEAEPVTGDDEEPQESPDDTDTGGRGERGERGDIADLPPVETVDSDDGDASDDLDDVDPPTGASTGTGEDRTGGAGPGSRVGVAVDTDPSNLPLVAGAVAVTALGGVFWLAARRRELPTNPATSNGGRRIQE